jgi:hypothetical protein
MSETSPPHHPALPSPRRERWPVLLALACLLAGAGLLAVALTTDGGSTTPAAADQPVAGAPAAVTVAAPPAPTPAVTQVPAAPAAAPKVVAKGKPSAAGRRQEQAAFRRNAGAHVAGDWISGFYAIYDQAARTFGVNWLLLASVHKQETAFSTAGGTYQGLNFAGCCAGPMQFNVRNRPVSTWRVFQGAYHYGSRPEAYPHATGHHPSVYDDFDSIMAGAWLLSASGARTRLDGTAWQAAFDYYGHDATGVGYADQVLARAIGWSQHRFCANCEVDPSLVDAVHGAYGAPVLATFAPPAAKPGDKRHGAGKQDALAAMKGR